MNRAGTGSELALESVPFKHDPNKSRDHGQACSQNSMNQTTASVHNVSIQMITTSLSETASVTGD